MKSGNIEATEITASKIIADRFQVHWSTATQVGTSFSISASIPALAGMTDQNAAFIDSANDELQMYSFVNNEWSLVGSGLTISGVGYPALARLTDTDVALVDRDIEELQTYSFSGSEWSLVGSGLSISGIGIPALAGMGGNRVALMDNTLEELQMYSFSGSEWSLVGSGLTISGAGIAALASLSSLDLAYFDRDLDVLRTYGFSGSEWSMTGSELAISMGVNVTLTALNDTDIVFNEQRSPAEMQIYRFDRVTETWSAASPVSYKDVNGLSSNTAIAALTGTDIAYFQAWDDKLTTLRFNYSLALPFRP